jgi:hypothetical protein
MADVFISYAQSRRDLAEALAKDLEAEGLTVWWDIGLVPHQHFRKEIDAQLDAAGAVVILWTPESIGSLWVPSEADHALRQSKQHPCARACTGADPQTLQSDSLCGHRQPQRSHCRRAAHSQRLRRSSHAERSATAHTTCTS